MNNIINKIYSYFYSNFVKRFYKKVSEIDNKEDIYCCKNKLVVFVKSQEVGQQIYDIIKILKDRKETIYTHNMFFEINKYIINNEGRVESFCMEYSIEREWKDLSKIEKLQELISFINDMQKKGYVLEESKFEEEKCSSISTFLSLFLLGDSQVETQKGYLVKYIHYILSDGRDLNEFYQRMVNNGICSVAEFPYALPVIKMCYNYFVTGNVDKDIYNTLQEENEYDNYPYSNYLIANKGCLDSKFALTESNDEYSIYDGNIKIYNNVSSDFRDFLIDYTNIFIKNNSEQSIEQIDKLIIDFNGNIIGYKFFTEEIQEAHTIFDKKFESQGEILDFMSILSTYLFRIFNMLCLDADEEKNNLNIEESLAFYKHINFMGTLRNFKITTIKELFNLAASEKEVLYKQLAIIFFKLFMTYLNQKYGQICDKEQFLDKIEVRLLSPILAREFINYALKKQVEYEVVGEEFYNFIYNTRKSTMTSSKELIFYDSRFEYNPVQYPFIFDYEAKIKYGIKIRKGMNKTLADGRILITFNRSKRISKIKDKEKSLRNEILEKLGDIEDKNVKIVGISEIIYSKNINTDDMYNVIGYITETVKGEQLTDNVLLNLSNKDFLKVAGYVFSKFAKYYIPWENIWMNDNMFYINILDENFQIKTCQHSMSNIQFINWVIGCFMKKGYNPYAFIDLDFSQGYDNLKTYLLNLSNSLNTYCDEHGIYYDDTAYKKHCPICKKTKYFVSYGFQKSASKILEDLYAKHYRIDDRYNLKVYKTSCVDMRTVEENVNKIMSSRLNSQELNLGQECFIPYKKALDAKNQFIGYIYEATQFSDTEVNINICNDIKDSKTLKNLPRLMSLIRLILQIKEITKRNMGFIENPFSYVFLSKGHKKQVQILNIEFLTEKGSIEDTIKWTCEYINEILTSDTSIEADILDCPNDLDYILKKLQDLSKEMTKYCTIHNMYYKKKYLFCPKCIENSQIRNLEVVEVEKTEITSKNQINEGGESFIYYYSSDLVAKVFKEEINYDLKSLVVAHVLEKRKILEGINKQNLKYKYIIPQKLLADKETCKIFGYIMEKVSGMPISNLRDKAEVERLGVTMKDVFEILIAVGKGIETLHANNIYIGDLNGRNILFDTQKNVYFLDFDGMGVDNIAPEFCTDGYIDPVSKKNQNITMKDDWYSFAVQAFYYLTFTHPFNGIYSVVENGKKVILDIPDKMERRISLLGKHGMKPPAIARSWDWMSRELKKAFFDTFEKDTRKSIVPYLINQYENFNIRVNPKFIAKELNLFGEDVVYIINHYAAVCKKDNKYYVSILINYENEKILTNIESLEHRKINDVLLSDNKKIAFVIYLDEVVVISLKTNTVIYSKAVSNTRNVVVNGNTLYFTGISMEENIIFQIEIVSNEEVKEDKIKFLPKQRTKRFHAEFNSKFMLVKNATEGVDEIYCNSEKLCDMNYNLEDSEYNIIYDDATKLWLVVSSEGNGIVVNALNGAYKKFNIQESINGSNIKNISFDKGMIYIPNQDCLHIVNTNDQITTKKMECNKIMTPNSKLYDINTSGFSVITDNSLYEIRRG